LTVLFADGRVETLPPSTSAEDLKAMITIAGGEVVELPSEFR
jgi:hypothetical protein